MPKKLLLVFVFTAAFLLRLIVVPNPGFEADVSFWKSWGLAARDLGVVEGVKITNNNYPTPFSYTMALMVRLYSLFADPHNFNQFWQNTNLPFLFSAKIFPVLADLGIAGIILYIGSNAPALGFPVMPFSYVLLLTSFYLFNPISIIDGAWWGQVDSVGVFIFLVAFLLTLKRRPFLAGAIFMLSMMTKLQNMIYGPLLFLFMWQTLGFSGLVKGIAGAAVGFFGLNIEFFFSRNMDRVIASLTQNFDYFPWMSLNAFNLWWIVAGAHGMEVSDKLAVLGITNAKTVGLSIFSTLYLFAMLRQTFGERAGIRQPAETSARYELMKNFFENLIIINAAFFLFQTQSHDRYAFPISVFLLLWAPFVVAISDKREVIRKLFNLFTFSYFLFTLLYFYNLHTALVFNYPKNGLPLLSQFISAPVTITVSVLLIGLFLFYLFVLHKTTSTFLYIIPLSILILLLVKNNSSLITHSPVSLTRFTPYISQQGFGARQTDRSVNSFYGTKSWNRLSVQYVFYKHGIGTHANSLHVFDINRKFRRFSTDYGIDTEAGPQGSAVFEIYGDNKLLFRSDTMVRYELPRHAEVDVTGVKMLGIVTTDAGNGNVDDHTDWLNPQLWP